RRQFGTLVSRSFFHAPKLAFVRARCNQATGAHNKSRLRRLSLSCWREIAAKEIYQSRPSAARVSVSIENKADCPTLTRIFDVGHIVAFGKGRKGSEGIRCARSFDHGRDEVLRREHVAAAASRIPGQEPIERSSMNSWDDKNFVA